MKRLPIVLFCIVLAIATLSGCRSTTKSAPPAPPAPPATDTDVAVTAPVGDFSGGALQTTDEVDNADIDELNRLARERGWIADAFFGFDSTTLTAEAKDALTRSARWLREHPRIKVTIEGHCDERGTEQYNLALGERRAAVAQEYMASLGVGDERMSTQSFGEEQPFAEGSDESAWAQNRRAHLVLRR